MKLNKNLKILIIFDAIIITLVIGFLLGRFIFPEPTPVTNNPIDCTLNNSCGSVGNEVLANFYRKFYYSRITIVGKDKDGKDFSIMMNIPRKQKSKDVYEHYYSAYFTYGTETKLEWTNEDQKTSEVVDTKFLTNFTNIENVDSSTREEIEFDLRMGTHSMHVRITDVNGDFLVKNKDYYTRYVSNASASIQLDGQDIQANAVVDKIFSNDFSKAIYFEGRDTIDGHSYHLAFWDTDKVFYLVDYTDVKESDLPYKSHRWILKKDEDMLQKAFDAEIVPVMVNDKPKSLSITIPDMENAKAEVSFSQTADATEERGIIKGTIKINGITKDIYGYLDYSHYEPKK